MLRHLDLFSGIGGFALAARMVGGYETVAFCEIDKYCQAVLRKHWPGVPIHDDIRQLTASDVPRVDIITGGFPCQDISSAGKGAGIDGERSGLWRELHRLIDECRPRFALIENVPALRTRGADRVLGDLEKSGYTAKPFVVGAGDIGAPHRRRRVWIVAYADSEQLRGKSRWGGGEGGPGSPFTKENGETRLVAGSHGWRTRPKICGMDDGLPGRAHRIGALGNAIVPQVAAIFLQAIKEC